MEKLSIMEAKLKAIKEQSESLAKKQIKLANKIVKYKLENALYHPMSELVNYKNKSISCINLVEKKQNGKLDTDYMFNDGIFEVTKDGYLYYSSYEGGVMDYCKEDGKYYHYFYGRGTPHEYVGFLEIELEEEW